MKKAKKIRVLSYAATKRKLDAEFAAMIRARDSGLRCISCGERPPEQAGHFIRREILATRWHYQNVNGQCAYCNKWLDGNQFQYGTALNRRYGMGTTDKLMGLARNHKFKLKTNHLQELRDAVKDGYDDFVIKYEALASSK